MSDRQSPRAIFGISEGFFHVGALLLFLALGALNLEYPFVGDQVIALLGGKTLAAGKILYVDFWDNKMPGLFWFYCLAGQLFGFDEFGIHLFELLWMTGFALVLMHTLRSYFQFAWMSALAPLATVGVYYAIATQMDLTQVEILMALPLYLCAWFSSRVDLEGRQLILRYFLSGLAAGIVFGFKIVLGGIAGAFWIVAAAYAWKTRRQTLSAVVFRMWLPAAVGVLFVVAIIVLRAWMDGALYELYWTAFIYPPQALVSAPHAPYLRLAQSSLQFLSFYTPWAFLIVLALVEWWFVDRDLLTTLLVAWLVVAVVLILVQTFSWWPYHFLLLFTPCGILGLRGAAVIPHALRARRIVGDELALVLALALAFAPLSVIAAPLKGKLLVALEAYARHDNDPKYIRRYVSNVYLQVEASVKFLSAKTARPGAIYVFGNPTYYFLSGRPSALPIVGWPWQYFLQSQWLYVPEQLERALPAYIYIDRDNDEIIRVREGGVGDYIKSAYLPFATDYNGTWYQVRPELWRARHGTTPGG